MAYKIYKSIWEELISVCTLYPGFCIRTWMIDEGIFASDTKAVLHALKKFREQLELDNHIMCDEEETKELLEEGENIYSVIVKERNYGKED